MANRVWKWVGLAGLAGVAATGVIVARDQRERRAYEPDDVRARLHERAAALSADPAEDPAEDPAAEAAAEPAAGSESAAAPHGTGARRWWWPWRRWHRVTPDASAPPT